MTANPTIDALQRLAEHVLSKARHAATGRIGLRATEGGVGTPPFPSTDGLRAVRIEGTELVVADNRGERRAPITTVRAAAELAEVEPGAPTEVYTPHTPLEPDEPLELDPATVARVAAWYRLVDDALAQLRTEVGAGDDVRAQLWPEHFDLALTIDEVNYGGSPGDETHDEPYLYVGPWQPPAPDGDFWNEPFGSSRGAAEVATVEDALAYFRAGRERLADR